MAAANAEKIKVTYRVRGSAARAFHLWASQRGLKKDFVVDRLLSALASGKITLPQE